MEFVVREMEHLTGLDHFGEYLSKMLTLDAFFLNEDRHTHNIAVLMDDMGEFHECPFFDHGAGLLSDTTMDYPMEISLEKLLGTVHAKTFCPDFDQQLDMAEELYGQQIRFYFTRRDIETLLEQEKNYPQKVKERVGRILLNQMRKYEYLF